MQFLQGTHSDFNSVCSKMAKKTLGKALKIRLGRVSGNTCNFTFGLMFNFYLKMMIKYRATCQNDEANYFG